MITAKPPRTDTTAIRLVSYGSPEWRRLIELNWTTYERDETSGEALMIYSGSAASTPTAPLGYVYEKTAR